MHVMVGTRACWVFEVAQRLHNTQQTCAAVAAMSEVHAISPDVEAELPCIQRTPRY